MVTLRRDARSRSLDTPFGESLFVERLLEFRFSTRYVEFVVSYHGPAVVRTPGTEHPAKFITDHLLWARLGALALLAVAALIGRSR